MPLRHAVEPSHEVAAAYGYVLEPGSVCNRNSTSSTNTRTSNSNRSKQMSCNDGNRGNYYLIIASRDASDPHPAHILIRRPPSREREISKCRRQAGRQSTMSCDISAKKKRTGKTEAKWKVTKKP